MKNKFRIREIISGNGNIEYRPEVFVYSEFWDFGYWKNVTPIVCGCKIKIREMSRAKSIIDKCIENYETKEIIHYIEK